MMIGDVDAKEKFKYLSKHGIRSIGNIFIENPRDLNDLISFIPEDTITGFQLRDIFDNNKKYSDIRRKIYDQILFNKRFPMSLNHHNYMHVSGDDDDG